MVHSLWIAPIGEAATSVSVGRALARADLGIEAPLLCAGAGIERDHLVEGRTEHDAVFDEQRRCFGFSPCHQGRRPPRDVAAAIIPRLDQAGDVGGRDLCLGRVARAAIVAAPTIPRRRVRHARHDDQQQSCSEHRTKGCGHVTPAETNGCNDVAVERFAQGLFPRGHDHADDHQHEADDVKQL